MYRSAPLSTATIMTLEEAVGLIRCICCQSQ